MEGAKVASQRHSDQGGRGVVLEAKRIDTEQQFREEEAAEDQTSQGQRLVHMYHPRLVLLPHVAGDQLYKNIG